MGVTQRAVRGSGGAFKKGSLGGKLSQSRTNGKSILGTLLAPVLPLFLTNNPLPNGFPWSTLNAHTNYYKTHPNTGVIRSYDFTISRDVIAPDGYDINALLVNGAYPGPPIEANWGDTIQVTVHNSIDSPDEGVSLHWHGFLQTGTPWEDGVPAVTQCPIPPGQSFTYQFKAELYGTSWYHSHYSAQYGGGLYGPIVIYGPRESNNYDIDLGPVLLSDWYHSQYDDIVKQIMSPGQLPFALSDNNLINGKNNFNCSTVAAGDDTPCNNNAGVSKFKFRRGKKHRLRLINTSAEALQRFSIDGHTMTVIANDFVTVQPYQTEVVTLGVGQRTDVIVTANAKGSSYWMRSNISTLCSLPNQPYAYAAIYYDNADDTVAPTSQAWDSPDPGTCANDDLSTTVPVAVVTPPTPDLELTFDIQTFQNSTGSTLWSLGNSSFRGNYNSPTLLLAKLGNHSFEEEWNVQNTGTAKSVRVTVINTTPIAHPMHLHGFNMYLVNEGTGTWDGTIVNPSNPQRRDVFMIRPNGYAVMQFDAGGNPGMWPFHCHIAWHVSAGLFVQFMTEPDEVERLKIPNVVAETCRQWGTWTKTNIPDQIDSGL